MRRIAFLSPLPPEASGIADYSAELLAGLRLHFDIDLFGGGTVPRPDGVCGLPVRPHSAFPEAHRRQPYEAVVYQLGNNPSYHRDIYQYLLRIPGVVVLHEYMIHHLIRGGFNQTTYIDTMRYCYGESGVAAAHRLIELRDPQEEWTYPLFERAVDASLALIVHSEANRRRVLRSRPGAPVSVVPLPAPPPGAHVRNEAALDALRAELKIPPGAFVIGSFGHVTPHKRVDVALRAFARLREQHPNAVYVIAGELSPHYLAMSEMLAGPIGQGVTVTGRVELSRLHEVMDLVDVAINLRYPVGGETSATCVRLLGLGKPVIVSAGGWFSEIPEGCCARIAPDRFEAEELTCILEALAADPSLREAMGTAAGSWANDWHSLERAVNGYTACIERVIADRPTLQAPVDPFIAAPADARIAIADELIATAADLGVPHTDSHLLPALAETLVDLGMQ